MKKKGAYLLKHLNRGGPGDYLQENDLRSLKTPVSRRKSENKRGGKESFSVFKTKGKDDHFSLKLRTTPGRAPERKGSLI